MGGRRTKTSKTLFLAAAVVALLVPMPVMLAPYPLIVLCYALVFAIACMGLNLLLGTTGLLSLGHATFFGIAAYAGAFLYRFTPVNSFELYLIFGLSFSALSAAAIGKTPIPTNNTTSRSSFTLCFFITRLLARLLLAIRIIITPIPATESLSYCSPIY